MMFCISAMLYDQRMEFECGDRTGIVRGRCNNQTIFVNGTGSFSDTQFRIEVPIGTIGEIIDSVEICPEGGHPLVRVECLATSVTGSNNVSGPNTGNWNTWVVHSTMLCTITTSEVTDRLEDLVRQGDVSLQTAAEIVNDTVKLSENATVLQPIDVVFISEILRKVVDLDTIDIENGQGIGEIIDNVIEANSTVILQADQLGRASKRITQSLEAYTLKANLSSTTHVRQTFKHLTVDMRDLVFGTPIVTGIKSLEDDDENGLQNATVSGTTQRFLRRAVLTVTDNDGSREEVVEIDVAIFLNPDFVKEAVESKRPAKLRLAFTIHQTDVLFQEPSQRERNNSRYVNSRIVSAAFGELNLTKLSSDQSVRTIFKPLEQDSDKRSSRCVFWDYEQSNGQGGWSSAGCSLVNIADGRYVCLCDHLTNFAILVDLDDTKVDSVHERILSTITLVGLSLSIVGLGITVLSSVLFRRLRADMSQKVFLNLALALMISWTLFLIGVILSLEDVHHEVGCKIVAICLHYFLLVSFMWMLVEAITQYLRYVKVMGTYIPRFMRKALIICWGFPVIPVVIVLAVNSKLYYRGHGTTVPEFCWMDQRTSYFAFLLPVGLIIVFNMGIFIRIGWALASRSRVLQSNQASSRESKLRLNAAIACFLLMGLTWVFGYLAVKDAKIPFQYIFTILNAFHGFFMFIFFVLREKRARDKWCGICCEKGDKNYSNSGQTPAGAFHTQSERINSDDS